MWTQVVTDDYETRLKRFEKKHPRELLAVLTNLTQLQMALDHGTKPLQIKFGFVHYEPMGVIAIDQKGGGKSLMQTRLYVYPEELRHTLHLITLGDKTTQRDDISTCRAYVAALRKMREHERQNLQKHPRINSPHLGGQSASEGTGAETSAPHFGDEAGSTPSS